MADPTKDAAGPDGLLDVDEATDTIVLAGDELGVVEPLPRGVFVKGVTGLLTLAAMITASYLVPVTWAQPWRADEDYVPFWNIIGREFMGQEEAMKEERAKVEDLEKLAREAEDPDDEEAEAIADRPVVAPPKEIDRWPEYEAHEDDAKPLEFALDNPEALDSFYAALMRTDLGYPGAVTRVAHWGDSVVGGDGIPGNLRLRMQKRFGDGGHGFHGMSKYDPSYRQKGVRFLEKGAAWGKCVIIRRCKKDGLYGYGGVTYWSAGGSESVFSTARKGAMGRKMSRFEVWYRASEKSGNFRIKVDKQEPIVVETRSETPEDRWKVIELEDGEHSVSVRATGGGRVRFYGVAIDRDGPGVTWDGMPLIGSFTNRMGNQNPEHFAGQLQHRGLNLAVLMFGGNDMQRKALLRDMTIYEEEYRQVIQLVKNANPKGSCLVISALDHGEWKNNRVVSRKIVPSMIDAQKKVAVEEGCAFFNMYEAMGGEGSMGRWYRASPKLGSGDLAHPTHAGHRVVAQFVYRALMGGYADYRKKVAGTPVGEGGLPEAPVKKELLEGDAPKDVPSPGQPSPTPATVEAPAEPAEPGATPTEPAATPTEEPEAVPTEPPAPAAKDVDAPADSPAEPGALPDVEDPGSNDAPLPAPTP